MGGSAQQPPAPPIMRDIDFTPILPGGQFIDSRTPLSFIMIAFGLRLTNVDHVEPPTGLSARARGSRRISAESPAEGRRQDRLPHDCARLDR